MRGPNTNFWPISINGKFIGKVTSAVYSPRLKKNIALAMLDIQFTELGQLIEIHTDFGHQQGVVVEKPFFDPKKAIASS